MKAHIISIGDELLIGQTVNTNAAWIGQQLSMQGIEVVAVTTIGDAADAIRHALDEAFEHATLVVTTGGLGPTHDDVTKRIVAEYFGRALAESADLMARIRQYYDRSGRDVPDAARQLALVPEGFDLLRNPIGTAPGLWYASEGAGRERLLAVLPGVPQEMKGIMDAAVLPRLKAHGDLQAVQHRTLQTTGIGESSLQEKIEDLVADLEDALHLAYLPSTSGVRLRLSAFGSDAEEAETRLDAFEDRLRERIDTYIFGRGDQRLETVLGELLRERGLTVATAESCTGGFVAHRFTNVSGSSDYFVGSVIAYANGVKVNQLGVDPVALQEEGAVSEAVALQMAHGVRQRLDADIGVATTGIAGPSGGTPEKPVGTIWLGYADAQGERAVRLQFAQDRQLNKELFSTSALELVRRQLLYQRKREEAVR